LLQLAGLRWFMLFAAAAFARMRTLHSIKMMNFFGLMLAFLLLAGPACKSRSQTLNVAADKPQSYACSGVVQQVDASQGRVTIHHKEIPNYMPEMTMGFNVKNTNELNGILSGAEIRFNLLVLRNDAWIENVRLLGYLKAPAAGLVGLPVNNARELRAGDQWPDGELLAEDGHFIHFSDFRGRTVALTFFFTRCPLPDYCPRMNNNFNEARWLLSSPTAQTNYTFLSISFDPDFDTPEILSGYTQHYRQNERGPWINDPCPWLFAVASKDTLARLPSNLGLVLNRQGNGITHNLRTVVLDPQGRVYRQFDGNHWTPQELAGAMKEASQLGNTKGPL
jgi:protein SCO1/2